MILDSIALNLTERCNFACAHCIGDYGPNGEDMTLPHVFHCLELAARQEVGAVFLSGGEPTLHPDWLSCIEKSVSLGLYTVLCSNGSFPLERLEGMQRAGLQELHLSYDKFRAPYISVDRVKRIIDNADALGITPVLVINEANSYEKYKDVLGDYYRYGTPDTSAFQPLLYAGRAIGLPWAEFQSDEPYLVTQRHGFCIFVQPDGRASFCPANNSFASTRVDLASDWLDGIVDTFSRDPTVQMLVNEGVSGLLRRYTGRDDKEWASTIFSCNFCLQLMTVGELIIEGRVGDDPGTSSRQTWLPFENHHGGMGPADLRGEVDG